jgi:hypothetical protein
MRVASNEREREMRRLFAGINKDPDDIDDCFDGDEDERMGILRRQPLPASEVLITTWYKPSTSLPAARRSDLSLGNCSHVSNVGTPTHVRAASAFTC